MKADLDAINPVARCGPFMFLIWVEEIPELALGRFRVLKSSAFKSTG